MRVLHRRAKIKHMSSQRMGLKLDMPLQTIRCSRAIFVILLLCVSYGAGTASGMATLDEVTVSSDLRRVIMKASGPIAQYNAFELDRPPRLVVDIAGTLPRKALKIPPPAQNGGLKIVVAESRSGTHVVLDFGGAPVPVHRIRRMDSYLIVFVDDWRPLRRTPVSQHARKKSSADRAPVRPKPAAKSSPLPEPEKKSDLTIHSAEVIDGLIVLKVADRTDPQRLYRIDLGVNFQKMGFVSAGIYPLTGSAGWQLHPAGNHNDPAASTPGMGKIGPRKAAGPLTTKREAGVRNTVGVKQGGPRGGPTKAALGPTRTPRRGNSIGPVSLRGDKEHDEGILCRIQRQSVSARAWKLLNAYRQAPLVQTQRCGFSSQRSSPSLSIASDSEH